MAIAKNLDWKLHQLDVKSALLNEEVEEEVYVEIPPGLGGKYNGLCRLLKSLYGLKQSPIVWIGRFNNVIKEVGFKQCDSDHTLFVKHGSKEKLKNFEIKDLEALKYFFGIGNFKDEIGYSSYPSKKIYLGPLKGNRSD